MLQHPNEDFVDVNELVRLRTDLYVVIHDPTGVCEVGMLGVDVGQFDGNQVMDLRQETMGTITNRCHHKHTGPTGQEGA